MYFSRKNKRKSIPRCLTTPTPESLTLSQVLCQFIVAYYTWFLALLPPHYLSHNRACNSRVSKKKSPCRANRNYLTDISLIFSFKYPPVIS